MLREKRLLRGEIMAIQCDVVSKAEKGSLATFCFNHPPQNFAAGVRSLRNERLPERLIMCSLGHNAVKKRATSRRDSLQVTKLAPDY